MNRLRDARFSYKDRADRTELYRQAGTGQRVNLSLRDLLPEDYVRTVLRQATLTVGEIEDFIAAAIKT